MASNFDWLNPKPYGQAPTIDPMTGQTDFLSMMNPMTSINNSLNTPSMVPMTDMSIPTQPLSTWDSFQNWMGESGVLGRKLPDGTQMQGWGMPALSALSGLSSAFFGMKQLGLAKDTLEQNKKQFQLNFEAQRKTTNAALEDRQAARVASNPGAYQSVGDYMKRYGI